MEKSHNTDVRSMLDEVAMELREYQGQEGNMESCTQKVKKILQTEKNYMFSVAAFLQATIFKSWNVSVETQFGLQQETLTKSS